MKIRLDPLDLLFSRYMRLKADNHCEYCGEWKDIRQLQVSHFHGRRKRSTRWFEDNCVALCFSCHMFLDENPYVHNEFFRKRLGAERFEQLCIRAEITPAKIDKERLRWELKEKITLLEESNRT